MEKLLELANQFELEREKWIESFKDNELPLWEWSVDTFWDLSYESNKDFNWEDCYWDTAMAVFISKHYWFIEWLVENDKIDFQIWNWEKYLEYPIWSDNYDGVYDYKDIIQWLSISDTPIEDLLLYLK